MANPITIQNPYSVDPSTFVNSAMTPMTGQTVMPTMAPANYNGSQYYGPTHAALSQAFQAALQQQMGVPGLLSQMQADPAMAQRIGGLLSNLYTPSYYAPNRLGNINNYSLTQQPTLPIMTNPVNPQPTVPGSAPLFYYGQSPLPTQTIPTDAPYNPATGFATTQNVVLNPAPPAPAPAPVDTNNNNDYGGACCFDPNAPVLMADGSWKRIADVKVGDVVMSSNGTPNKVMGLKSTTVGNRKMMQFEGHDFFATDDHLFLTDKGWKTWRPDRLIDHNRENAMFLKGDNQSNPFEQGDKIVMFDNGGVIEMPYAPAFVETHEFAPDYVVHDLHLDGDRTYIVDGFVVHNCGGEGGAGGGGD